MASDDWLLSPAEIKSLELVTVAESIECAPRELRLWQVDADGGITLVSEPSEIPALDIIAIPTGKFLPEDFAYVPQAPEHERIRKFAHLSDLPPRTPVVPQLIDAPANPLPAPAPVAEPEASPDPLRPTGIELDRDAVLVSFAEHRAKRETATEIVHRIHKEHMAKIPPRDPEPLPQEPKPARMVAMPPPWTPHS